MDNSEDCRKMRMYLTSLNCVLEMIKLVRFMLLLAQEKRHIKKIKKCFLKHHH